MLSGVGPAQHLEEHGIPVVLDLPGVGSHLVDHPIVDFYFKDKFDASSKFLKPKTISDVGKFFSAIAQYHILGTGGPLATNVSVSMVFDTLKPTIVSYKSSENLLPLSDRTTLCFSLAASIQKNWKIARRVRGVLTLNYSLPHLLIRTMAKYSSMCTLFLYMYTYCGGSSSASRRTLYSSTLS